MTVFVRAPMMKRGERVLSFCSAGKMYGSGWREADIMDQKRAVPSIGGSEGKGGSSEEDEEGLEGATTGSEAGWFVGSIDCGEDGDDFLLLPSTGLATSSDSRLTGSPIVVSFANFDSEGLSESFDFVDVI